MEFKLTFDFLPIVATLLVLAGFYFPWFKTWYEKLSAAKKQGVMLVFLAASVAIAALGSYFGFFSVYALDTLQEWIWYPCIDFVIALMVNAGVYKSINYLAKNGA